MAQMYSFPRRRELPWMKGGAMPQPTSVLGTARNRTGAGGSTSIAGAFEQMPQGGPFGGAQPPAATPSGSISGPYGQLGSGTADQNTFVNLANYALGGQTIPGSIFSPEGSAASQAARHAELDRIGQALQRRAALAKSAQFGLDPSQRGFADFWSNMGIQGGLAKAYGEASQQQALEYENMLRDLFAQLLGYNLDLGRGEQAGIWQRRAAGAANRGGGGVPAFLGQLGGKALGAYLG